MNFINALVMQMVCSRIVSNAKTTDRQSRRKNSVKDIIAIGGSDLRKKSKEQRNGNCDKRESESNTKRIAKGEHLNKRQEKPFATGFCAEEEEMRQLLGTAINAPVVGNQHGNF